MAGRELLLLAVFVIPATAQMDAGFGMTNRVRVHVAYSGGVCDRSTKVELMQGMTSVARGTPDKSCTIELIGVPAGSYRMVVSGRGFSGIETNEISVTSLDTDPIEIKIPQQTAAADSVFQSAETSVSDLRIPKRAAKEFLKAGREMEQQQWKEAETSLDRAIAIYPKYAAAYNNLGVVYARNGDRSREADALQQAISIDDHYVPAYVNLARMDIAENKFPDAESKLRRAADFDPENGIVLVLLTYAEYMNHRFDAVIRDCNKVHALNSVPHAFAHWSAAFALEQKEQIKEAGEEFRTFVKEEPSGQRADDARKEIANIEDYFAEEKRAAK